MLTRLRIQGFKNLLDVELHFGPFTCVAGLNGAGKSNVFDAVHFLHLLSRHPIMEAVRRLRETKGRAPEPRSLFTTFQGFQSPQMRFEVDLIINRSVQDDFGVAAEASISTLRYKIGFRLTPDETGDRLELIEESLEPIALKDARRNMRFPASKEFLGSCMSGRRSGAPFISYKSDAAGAVIQVHQEGHGGRKVPGPKSTRTVLGGMASSDYPTVLAAHREMESWTSLMLEPSAMRAPSIYRDDQWIDARGANLPAAIFRLQRAERQSGQTCAELANVLAELIEDIREVRVIDEEKAETWTLEVRGQGSVFHPARSLSDGTLRFLVLAALSLDPDVKGLICLEEPENGIHPERIAAMVRLLKDIAVDASRSVDDDNPLRQVIVNTHSPEVFQNVDPKTDLVYLEEVLVARNGAHGRVAALRVPSQSWRAEAEGNGPQHLAPGRIRSYLGYAAPPEQRQLWLDFCESNGPS